MSATDTTSARGHPLDGDSPVEWETEPYSEQQKHWPTSGKHILAQYNDQTIVVYQAFCPEIAKYAIANQRFGGSKFSFTRMSWIKTNFLWMMYRCGWASKPSQEHVLAIWIKRENFDEILSKAYTAQAQKREGIQQEDVRVRLQWDPDHTPGGSKEERRAIQMGLRGEMLRKYATDWIVRIEDITPTVLQQAQRMKEEKGSLDDILVARERVYQVCDARTSELIGVDNLSA